MICGDVMTAPLLTRTGVPVVVNKTFGSQSEAQGVERGDITLAACTRCGFVSNLAFDPTIELYDDSYDNGQTGSARFRNHVSAMALRVRAMLAPAGSVVEVGCGQAEFLTEIVNDTSLTGFGFDPAYTGPPTLEDGRVTMSASFEPPAGARGDVVVSRHVVEHVSDPFPLLEVHRDLTTDGGAVVIETPDLLPIIRGEVFHDVFYEHCSLFTAKAFAWAAHRMGMNVRRADLVFDDWFLWTELVLGKGEAPAPANFDVAEALSRMARAESQVVRETNDFLSSNQHAGGVVVWGAAAKGSTFLHLCDPTATKVAAAVDVNPTKQGRYMAGTGHAIVPPDHLLDLKPNAVVVMNPSYAREIVETLRELGLGEVRVFDDRLSAISG